LLFTAKESGQLDPYIEDSRPYEKGKVQVVEFGIPLP